MICTIINLALVLCRISIDSDDQDRDVTDDVEDEDDDDENWDVEGSMSRGVHSGARGGLAKLLRSMRLLGMTSLFCEGIVRVLTAVMLLDEVTQSQPQPQNGDNSGGNRDAERLRIVEMWKEMGVLLGCDAEMFKQGVLQSYRGSETMASTPPSPPPATAASPPPPPPPPATTTTTPRSEEIPAIALVLLTEVLYDALVRTVTRATNQALTTLTPPTTTSSSSSSSSSSSLLTLSIIDYDTFEDCHTTKNHRHSTAGATVTDPPPTINTSEGFSKTESADRRDMEITAVFQSSSMAFVRLFDIVGGDNIDNGIIDNGDNNIGDDIGDGGSDHWSLRSLLPQQELSDLAPDLVPSPLWTTFTFSSHPSSQQPVDSNEAKGRGKEREKEMRSGRNIRHVLYLQSNHEHRPNVIDGQALLRQLRQWDVLSMCRMHRQIGYYCHWSLMGFVRRYAMLVDGLPTVLFDASNNNNNNNKTSSHLTPSDDIGVGGVVSDVSLLATCQLLLDHLTTLDDHTMSDDEATASGAACAPVVVVAAAATTASSLPHIDHPSHHPSHQSSAHPSDHPIWHHLNPYGVYLRTHHQWTRLENYRHQRAHILVTRIQGIYRQYVARRVLMVTTQHTLFLSICTMYHSTLPIIRYSYVYFFCLFDRNFCVHVYYHSQCIFITHPLSSRMIILTPFLQHLRGVEAARLRRREDYELFYQWCVHSVQRVYRGYRVRKLTHSVLPVLRSVARQTRSTHFHPLSSIYDGKRTGVYPLATRINHTNRAVVVGRDGAIDRGSNRNGVVTNGVISNSRDVIEGGGPDTSTTSHPQPSIVASPSVPDHLNSLARLLLSSSRHADEGYLETVHARASLVVAMNELKQWMGTEDVTIACWCTIHGVAVQVNSSSNKGGSIDVDAVVDGGERQSPPPSHITSPSASFLRNRTDSAASMTSTGTLNPTPPCYDIRSDSTNSTLCVCTFSLTGR